jgi:hypothetical protein
LALNEGDSVLFIGRRPQGDTTWLDEDDTTAVFFLTTRNAGQRLRFSRVVGGLPAEEARLTVDQHLEMDTGYYHLGSGGEPVDVEYNTSRVFLEGFYWSRLNASDSTLRQQMQHRMDLLPAEGANLTVSAHYAATVDAERYKPDTRAVFTVNDVHEQAQESDGVGNYTVTVTVPSSAVLPGLQSLKLYSTGIDSVINKPLYLSEILLDWIRVQTDVIPALVNGRSQAATDLSVSRKATFVNADQHGLFVVDTTTHWMGSFTPSGRSDLVTVGMGPQDRPWIKQPRDLRYWRMTARFGDASVNLDSITSAALVVQRVGSPPSVTLLSNGEAAFNGAIQSLVNGDRVAVVVPGTSLASATTNALSQKGISTPVGMPYWTSCGTIGRSLKQRAAATPTTMGATVVDVHAQGREWSYDVVIPRRDTTSTLLIADHRGLEVARVEPAHLADLSRQTDQTDLIIVTHAVHKEQAERLAAFRRSFNGVTTRVVDIDDVIDEFGAGDRSPSALRDYLQHVYRTAQGRKPQYVILFGNTSWDPRLAIKFGNANSRRADQIPTYGRPSSDYYYSVLDDPSDLLVPDVYVGRIPALTADEGRNHVDKIISYDTTSFKPWMRRFMFVGGGGSNESLCNIYEFMLEDFTGSGITYHDAPLCLDTVTLCKETSPPNPGFYVKQEINRGLGWLNYLGHGSTTRFDITGWEPPELDNAGLFGIMATYACQTGAFSNPSVTCENARYLTEPNKGFSAAIGGTGWAYIWTVGGLLNNIHALMRDPGVRNIGEVVYRAKLQFAGRPSDQNGINTLYQFCILGDPLARVRIDTVPRPYVLPSSIKVTSIDQGTVVTDDDSLAIADIMIYNAGTGTDVPYRVRLIREHASRVDTFYVTMHDGLCVSALARYELPVRSMTGEHRLTATVDVDGVFQDGTPAKTVTSTFTVYPQTLLPLIPGEHETMSCSTIHVRVLDPQRKSESDQEVRFSITRLVDTGTVLVLESATQGVLYEPPLIDWKADRRSKPLEEGPAFLTVVAIDRKTARTSAILEIPIVLTNEPSKGTAIVPAQRFMTEDENVSYNASTQRFELARKIRDVSITSWGVKSHDISKYPPIDMKVAGTSYVKNPFYSGINIMLVAEHDSIPRLTRRYDTRFSPNPIETGHNGFSADCITFLEDSLRPGDRVFIASADESFEGFIKDGTLDHFRSVIKGLGSRFADSLAPYSSWAMIGKPDSRPESAIEEWTARPDSVVVLSSTLPFYSREGTVRTPWIGPMRHLFSVLVDQDLRGCRTVLHGKWYRGLEFEISVLDSSRWWALDDYWTSQVAWVRTTTTLTRLPGNDEASTIGDVSVFYDPADELLVENSNLQLDPDNIMRADTMRATLNVRNARFDQSSAPTSVRFTASTSNSSMIYVDSVALGVIAPDGKGAAATSFSTINASMISTVKAAVNDSAHQSERYAFNNIASRSFSVFEDSEPPTITIVADGVDATGKAYVQRHPRLEVRLHDNSRLPINDPERVLVFINGTRIRTAVADSLVFLPTDSCAVRYADPSIRAALIFGFELEDGQNNILVRAQDATGNNSEYEGELWVTNDRSIDNVLVSPNPSDGNVQFTFTLRTSEPHNEAALRIYDGQGRLVRTLRTLLSAGRGRVQWDGRGEDGVSLPSGAFHYRLESSGSLDTRGYGANGTLLILH